VVAGGQNPDQGLAASTDQTLLQARSERERLPDAVRSPRGSSLEAGARKWVHRLRLQQQDRCCKLRACEVLPSAEMRDRTMATSRTTPLTSTTHLIPSPARDTCHRGVLARAPLDTWALQAHPVHLSISRARQSSLPQPSRTPWHAVQKAPTPLHTRPAQADPNIMQMLRRF
jgi:hypothetical protein